MCIGGVYTVGCVLGDVYRVGCVLGDLYKVGCVGGDVGVTVTMSWMAAWSGTT